MASAPRKIAASADTPAVWPNGVPGSRTVEVDVEDRDYAVSVVIRFGHIPGQPLEPLSIHIRGLDGERSGLNPRVFREALLPRWEKAGRAAVEHRLVTASPTFQHVEPASLAESIVAERFPELAGPIKGNALRRRKSLLHLATVVQEYKLAESQGATNPAEVVAAAHGVATGTVRSWLTRARREDLAPASGHRNAVPRG
ncbi:hypothetical protein [Streptomyces sp. IBSBF 2435]|uniref:hypothetical protein n=1 Tax=Streptomyces sp. IBSBF 2435 TaxID=2903531 RepID=UPI002FDC30CA